MKRAFTLIELVVYMAIMGFIIIVAGRVFSDSAKMRVRSQNMIKNSEELGRLSDLIKEDVAQMGTKAYGKSSASSYQFDVATKVYWDLSAADSSSYVLSKNHDSLFFRKMAFNQNGSYAGVREINWYFKDKKIYRSCQTVSGTEDPAECPTSKPDTVLMGSNISRLEFFPSKPGMPPGSSSSVASDILFTSNADNEFDFKPQQSDGDIVSIQIKDEGNNTQSVSGIYEKNSSTSGKKRAVLCLAEAGSCIERLFLKGETYAIEFEMPFVRGEQGDSIGSQFLLGEDHLAIGLRKGDYSKFPDSLAPPPDVLIYPPQSNENLLRHIEFTPKKDISASVVLTFAFYSEKAYLGRLMFKDFKVFRKNDEAFHFPKGDYGTEAANISEKYKQKKNAKAFEMILELENRGEKSGTVAKDENGNEKGMVILTPNNGI